MKTGCLPVAKVFFRPDLLLGAVCREIGWWGDLSQLSYHPFLFGSCSIVNCHCLHRFHLVFGGVCCSPLSLGLGSGLDLALLYCLALLFPPLPPPLPPIPISAFSQAEMAETPPTSHQRSQHAARQLECRTCAMHRPEGRRTPTPAAPSLSSIQPPTANGQMGPPPPPAPAPAPLHLLPLSPLLSLQLHLLHVHIHIHAHIHFLKLIMLGLSL